MSFKPCYRHRIRLSSYYYAVPPSPPVLSTNAFELLPHHRISSKAQNRGTTCKRPTCNVHPAQADAPHRSMLPYKISVPELLSLSKEVVPES
jgi:hypothetical protein